MPSTQQHLIRQQFLHVELFGTESDGLALQRQLPELCRLALLPALETALDRAAPARGHLRIERLAVDAGVVNLATLERDLVAAVTRAVEEQLRAQLGAATRPEDGQPAVVRRRTEEQSADEAFIFFLDTGCLPWWFRVPVGMSLEQALVTARQRQSSPGTIAYRTELLDAIGSAAVRKRLATQFSNGFLEDLLAGLAPRSLDAIREVFVLLEKSALAVSARRRFNRRLWQSALAGLAAGTPWTARSLVVATWDSLAPEERPVVGLPDWLEQHWPGAINMSEFRAGAPAGSDSDSDSGSNSRRVRTSGPLLVAEDAFAASAQSTCVRPNADSDGRDAAVSPGRCGPSAAPAASPAPGDESLPSVPGEAARSATPAAVDPRRARLHTGKAQAAEGAGGGQFRAEADAGDSRGHAAPRLRQAAMGESRASRRPASRERARIDLTEGAYVDCAGVILLHPFLPRFFEALGIANDDQIVQAERALCLLHFLASGESVAPEPALLLPKLLCNVPVEAAVESDVDLTASETDEAMALLQAVIGHWDALRNTTPDGLRGTFLTRPGKLSQRPDGDYLLQVESQSFDILLERLPWGIGVVKLPWMERMLWVEWAY
ncbi:contractile injection system tape measure protein [Accumulibacter sp.]|uniref:contractile injection system tape measure protein n=1 Tax=Accumulibacter sp. TaxID=2053492 RepID=UPI002C1B7CA6|nr:contractile injection system tape measure protein [Accumulibacter sp.]HPU78951.1 contractile injection system tape measure protein [Accumulibacter sp.]